MLTIAPAVEADVPVIVDLIRALAKYERLEHEMVATEDDILHALFGPRPYAEVILAREDDDTVGYALFFHNYSTFRGKAGIYLEDLFVLPERRGHGYGRALLVALARIAIERGCARYEWSVLDWNQPAIGFYRRMGAEVMEEWRICRVTGDALARLAAS
ncbi:MAG TPA: GNAT family N-acetyltransferase [Vicinamibacterales bacterium]|jgi:GNAT superfamily N-acetyltransferase|nr:GNAT family N-acetyltransferase [Vicinamibacterales bacterium]